MTPTQIAEMAKRTKVYERDLSAQPIIWRTGVVERLYGKDGVIGEIDEEVLSEGIEHLFDIDVDYGHFDVAGYIMDNKYGYSWTSADELPTEFFNHELMAVDPSDEESVYEFVSTWGFPYSPTRNRYVSGTHTNLIKLFGRFIDPCKQTEDLYEEVFAFRCRMVGIDPQPEIKTEWTELDFDDHIISLAEATETIRLLQESVKSIWDFFRSERKFVDLMAINHGACNPYTLGYSWSEDYRAGRFSYKTLENFGLLTAAICNQIIETATDATQWRECACEGCEVIFKRKQAKSSSPYAESIYCCKRCEERQKKRNQRKAAKNRIKH